MKRSLSFWQWMGFSVTAFAGTLLHFLYEWAGESLAFAPFSAVNESTWEHMKLLFFPLFLFALIQRRFFSERTDFWCVKMRGTLLGLFLIPFLFYGYNAVIGPSPDFVNIAIFFIAAVAVFLYETRLFSQEKTDEASKQQLCFSVFLIFLLLFVLFTFFPPHFALFQDPVDGHWGRI